MARPARARRRPQLNPPDEIIESLSSSSSSPATWTTTSTSTPTPTPITTNSTGRSASTGRSRTGSRTRSSWSSASTSTRRPAFTRPSSNALQPTPNGNGDNDDDGDDFQPPTDNGDIGDTGPAETSTPTTSSRSSSTTTSAATPAVPVVTNTLPPSTHVEPSSSPSLSPSGAPAPAPSTPASGSEGTVNATPDGSRSLPQGSSHSSDATTIAVPVAVSAFVLFLAIAAVLLFRMRRRRQRVVADGPDMIQQQQHDVGAGPATHSFGTNTSSSSGSLFFGGSNPSRRHVIPNPFADAESIHSRGSYLDTSDGAASHVPPPPPRTGSAQSRHPYATSESPFRDPDPEPEHGLQDYSDSPFRDSYAEAAHHHAAMEASRYAAPLLSTTPRGEAAHFIFGVGGSGSPSGTSLANTAGHSTGTLPAAPPPHIMFSAPPPPVPPTPDAYTHSFSVRSTMASASDYGSANTVSPTLVRSFPAPPAELTIPRDAGKHSSVQAQLIDLDSPDGGFAHAQ